MHLNYGLPGDRAASWKCDDGMFVVALNGNIPAIEAAFRGKRQNYPFLYAIIARELADAVKMYRPGLKVWDVRTLIGEDLSLHGTADDIAARVFAYFMRKLEIKDVDQATDDVPITCEAQRQRDSAFRMFARGCGWKDIVRELRISRRQVDAFYEEYREQIAGRTVSKPKTGPAKTEWDPIEEALSSSVNTANEADLSAEALLERERASLFGNEDEEAA
jgi:hypothetical protein